MGIETLVSLASINEPPNDTRYGQDVGGGTLVVNQQAKAISRLGYQTNVVSNTTAAFLGLQELRDPTSKLFVPPTITVLPLKTEEASLQGPEIFQDENWLKTAINTFRGYLTNPQNRFSLPFAHFYVAGKLMGTAAHEVGKPFIFMPHSLNRLTHYYMKDKITAKFSPARDAAELWAIEQADQILVSTEAEANLIANLYSKPYTLKPFTYDPATMPSAHPTDYDRSIDKIMYIQRLRRKIRVIPLGVDHQRFNPTLNDKMTQLQTRQEYGIATDADLVYGVMASRMSPIKNVETVISAFLQGKKLTGKKIVLAVFGGNLEDLNRPGSYLSKLKKQADNNVYFAGTIPAEKALSIMDVFISSSYYESFQLALAEAMSIGKPCILSDIPTLKEVSGNSQVYFDPFNPQTLTNAMLELALNLDYRQQLESAARNASDSLSWEYHVAEVMNTITTLGMERRVFTPSDLKDLRREREMTEDEIQLLEELRINRLDMNSQAIELAKEIASLAIKIDYHNFKLLSPVDFISRYRRWELIREKNRLESDLLYHQERLTHISVAEDALRKGDYDRVLAYFKWLGDEFVRIRKKVHLVDRIQVDAELELIIERIEMLGRLRKKKK